MHNFNPINIQRPVVNTFFKNVSLYIWTFWLSSIGNVSFQFSKVPTRKKYAQYMILYHMGKMQLMDASKANYLSIGYIYQYCTKPPKISSQGKWIARWTITSKHARGENLSSLHSIRIIYSFTFSNSLRFRILEHKSWKKLPNSNIQY